MKQILSYGTVAVILLASLQGQAADTTTSDSVALESIEEFESFDEIGSEMKFFGDYYVGIDQVSVDNIRIFGGDLFVAGRVEGQIIVLGGDVTLESTSIVNGQIVAIGGSIYKKEGAEVNGKVVEANIKEGISLSEGSGNEATPEYHDFRLEKRFPSSRYRWIHPDTHWFIYNRNEGFLWTPLNWHWNRRSLSTIRINFSLGYRFGLKESARRFAGRFTLEKSFFEDQNLLFFGSVFRESRTDDSYRLPLKENSLAALFARQDFYDRWDEEGYELGSGLNLGWIRVKTAYRSVEINSIPITHRQLKLFHKKRPFRSNENVLPLPLVPENVGVTNVQTISATLTTKTPGFEAIRSGAGLVVTGEKVLHADSFDPFTRLLSNVTANLELAADIVLRSRFLVGTTTDTLPEYRYFGVGGLGSVSAYPYKKQRGDRMLQTNVELIFLPDFLDHDLLIALFADAGHAWMQDAYDLTDLGKIMDKALTAIGIGIGDDDMDWRINIARPLDGRDVWETTFRLNLNF